MSERVGSRLARGSNRSWSSSAGLPGGGRIAGGVRDAWVKILLIKDIYGWRDVVNDLLGGQGRAGGGVLVVAAHRPVKIGKIERRYCLHAHAKTWPGCLLAKHMRTKVWW
jgi:hypothetical protein